MSRKDIFTSQTEKMNCEMCKKRRSKTTLNFLSPCSRSKAEVLSCIEIAYVTINQIRKPTEIKTSKHPGIVSNKKKNISEGASLSLGLHIAQLCLTLLEPSCTQAVKKSIQVLRLSLTVVQPHQRTVTQKRTDKIIEKLLL